jgi:hypothetical protein
MDQQDKSDSQKPFWFPDAIERCTFALFADCSHMGNFSAEAGNPSNGGYRKYRVMVDIMEAVTWAGIRCFT